MMMKRICFDGSLRLVNYCFFFRMIALLSKFYLIRIWLVMILETKNVFIVYVEVAIALRPLFLLS